MNLFESSTNNFPDGLSNEEELENIFKKLNFILPFRFGKLISRIKLQPANWIR